MYVNKYMPRFLSQKDFLLPTVLKIAIYQVFSKMYTQIKSIYIIIKGNILLKDIMEGVIFETSSQTRLRLLKTALYQCGQTHFYNSATSFMSN